MAEPPSSAEIDFYYRARLLRIGGWFMLAAIAGILGVGFQAYRSAGSLVRSEAQSESSDQRLASLRLQAQSISSRRTKNQDDFGRSLRDLWKKEREAAKTFYDAHGKAPCLEPAPSTLSVAGPFQVDQIAKMLYYQIDSWVFTKEPDKIATTMSFGQLPGPGLYLCLQMDDWRKLPEFISTEEHVRTANEHALQLQYEDQQLNAQAEPILGAISILQGQKDEAAKLKNAGLPAQAVSNTSDSSLLLQTTITRFGDLFFVSVIVTILIPIYRYNQKLAAFYTARGDALRLKREGVYEADFRTMAAALTPTYEFGKQPKTPIDKMIELVKAARGGEKL